MVAKASGRARTAGMGLGVPAAAADGAVCSPLPHKGEMRWGLV
jgi:hypothetical protein